jgi:small ligand-binding sensory domain FIST
VVGGAREVEAGPGVSLWAGATGPVTPLHLSADTPELPDVDAASAAIVLADPFSFPIDRLLASTAVPVIGGMAMGGRAPGGNRLLLDDRVLHTGAAGVVLGPSVTVRTIVSQGCRPIGNPLTVTRSEGNVVYELAGRPALQRLGELAEGMPEPERMSLYRGVHFGLVIDEHKTDFGRGDFLIRSVMGGDPESGAIQVGDKVEVGATAQFQIRDADSADEDLRQLVAGRRADAALLFTCNGRGIRLFSQPDHDASILSDSLDGAPIAGMFCAGELGPVGGHNFLHGFTASIALLSHASG